MNEHESVITIHCRGTEAEVDALTDAIYQFIYSDANKTPVGTIQGIDSGVCGDCENDPARLEPYEYPWELEEKK